MKKRLESREFFLLFSERIPARVRPAAARKTARAVLIFLPNIDIIKRYKQLGGKIITIGSDTHKIEDLASDFDVAIDILKQAGFDEIAVYHKRKPDFIKI